MNMPQPIPYQGSKRLLAKYILSYFPTKINNLFEPFSGSAAITIAAAYHKKANHYFLNDLNAPLAELLEMMINKPLELSDNYEIVWNNQLGKEKEYYSEIRSEFNYSHLPHHFLYLLARGVKGAIRYNSSGMYNQSPDNRRLGKHPATMRKEILFISDLLKDHTTVTSLDYKNSTDSATSRDLVYLDPPYQGVCTNRDSRYFAGISYDDLVIYLENLNSREIPFILSYDGKTGEKVHGKDLPIELGAHKIEISAGRSSSSTLNGGEDITIESLYISNVLINKLGLEPTKISPIIGKHIYSNTPLFL